MSVTRTITQDTREWAERWIAGLREGTVTALGGLPRKLEALGVISSEEAAALIDLDSTSSASPSAVADVLQDALFNGFTVMEARAARGLQ